MRWPSSSYFLPPNVIHGLTKLPILCCRLWLSNAYSRVRELTQREALCILVFTSESEIHKLVNSFASFQRPRWIEWPSHLLWFNILLASDSSLFGQQAKMQMSLYLSSVRSNFGSNMHTHGAYMKQSWRVTWAYPTRHARWMGNGSGQWCFGFQSSRDDLYVP